MSSKNILIGVTGSVATIKLPLILQKLSEVAGKYKVSQYNLNSKTLKLINFSFQIKVVFTENSKHFVKPAEFSSLTEVYSDADEWNTWKQRGDPIIHIDLVKWADLFIIAPLGKMCPN
jgi:phosphopantothenoylcysteine decarboxylase